MPTFPGDDAFEQAESAIFFIETRWATLTGRQQSACASGFAVCKLLESNRLILATAAHVVEFPEGTTVCWCVRQFNRVGQVVRECLFETTGPGNTFGWNKKLDVAWVALPTPGRDGTPFARSDEMPLPVIDKHVGVSAGTRVGWAGYPAQVTRALGRPHLCYFEGVVSAMVERPRALYIVDGHAAPGVSGGPVWQWSRDRERIEVVGIVSQYGQDEAITIPGFCMFEPINPLIYLFESWVESKKLRRR